MKNQTKGNNKNTFEKEKKTKRTRNKNSSATTTNSDRKAEKPTILIIHQQNHIKFSSLIIFYFLTLNL